jgi:hypothetical protein
MICEHEFYWALIHIWFLDWTLFVSLGTENEVGAGIGMEICDSERCIKSIL